MSEARQGGAEGLIEVIGRAGVRVDPRTALVLVRLWNAVADEPDDVVIDAVASTLHGTLTPRERPVVETALRTWLARPERAAPWWVRMWDRARRSRLGLASGAALLLLPLGAVAARRAVDPDLDGATAAGGPAPTSVTAAGELLDLPEATRAAFAPPSTAPPWWTPPWSLPGGDCAPADASVSPFAEETRDAIDNDCDGVVDLDTVGGRLDQDGDGVAGLIPAWGDAAGATPTTATSTPQPGATPDAAFDLCDRSVEVGTTTPLTGVDEDGDGCISDPKPLTRCPAPGEVLLLSQREDVDDLDPNTCEPDSCTGAIPAGVPGERLPWSWLGAAVATLLGGLGGAYLVRRWQLARDRAALPTRIAEAERGAAELRRSHSRDEAAAFVVPLHRLADLPGPLSETEVLDAVGGFADRGLSPTDRLDVRGTVEASARAGLPELRFERPRSASSLGAGVPALELWSDEHGPSRPFQPRVEALRHALRRLGVVFVERSMDPSGRLSGHPTGHPVLVLSARGRRPDRRAPPAVEELRARPTRAAWLHPSPEARLRPAGLDPALAFPFDANGLAAALRHLAGHPVERPAGPRSLGDLDRRRLTWLAARAPWASPLGLAGLLRALVPDTPESILLAADNWLGVAAHSADTSSAGLADTPPEPFPSRVAEIDRHLLRLLDRLEPAETAGPGARLVWRREVAQALARMGDPEGTRRLEEIAGESPHVLALTPARLAAMPEGTRRALEPSVSAWRRARGLDPAPAPALPTRRLHLVVGAAALLVSGLLGARAWQARAWPTADDLTLEIGAQGEARVTGVADLGAEVTLWQAGNATPIQLVPQGSAWVSPEPAVGCVQASALSGGLFHRSPPVGVQGGGVLVVSLAGAPAGAIVDLRVSCGDWLRVYGLDPGANEAELRVPACNNLALAWVVATADRVTVTRSVGLVVPAAARVPVPWPTQSPDVTVELGGRRVTVEVTEGGIPMKGLGLATSERVATWDLVTGQSAILPVLPDGERWETCVRGDRCGSWAESGQSQVSVAVEDPNPYQLTVITPSDVPPDEIFVRDPPGGAHAWSGDVLTLARPQAKDPPFVYSLELGGAEAWYTAIPKPENWYDVTKAVEVTDTNEPGTVDLRGPKVYGWVYVTSTGENLGRVIDLQNQRTPSGATPAGSAKLDTMKKAYLVSKPGTLDAPLLGGRTTSVEVKAGELVPLVLDGSSVIDEVTTTGGDNGGPIDEQKALRWTLTRATLGVCQDDESDPSDRVCEFTLVLGEGRACTFSGEENSWMTPPSCSSQSLEKLSVCEDDITPRESCTYVPDRTGAEDNALKCVPSSNAPPGEALFTCIRKGEKDPNTLVDLTLTFEQEPAGAAAPAKAK